MSIDGTIHKAPISVTGLTPLLTAAEAETMNMTGVTVFPDTQDIWVGGPDLTAANGSLRVPAGTPLVLSHTRGVIYAVAVSGTTAVRVSIHVGVRQ